MGDRNRWFNRRNLLLALLGVQLVCLLAWVQVFPEPIKLAFVIPDEELGHWQSLTRGFERKHPGVQIELVRGTTTDTTDERAAIYKADFDADVPQHDLVYMDITWTPEFAEHLIDLGAWAQRDSVSLDGFVDSEIQAGEHDGRLYRMPMRSDIGLLFYRKDLLEAMGKPLPKTSEDLQSIIQILKAGKGRDQAIEGYLWQGGNYEGLVANFVEVLSGMGGTWINPNTGQPMLDTATTLDAAKALWQMIYEDQLSPKQVTEFREKDSLEQFLRGNAIFARGWPASYQTMTQKKGFVEHIGITLPFSSHDKGDTLGKGCRGGWGFGIPKDAPHPEEAWDAIKYFTSADAQKDFVLKSGFLPSRVDLFSDPDILAHYPYMAQILQYLEDEQLSVFRPSLKQYTDASEILQQALSEILALEGKTYGEVEDQVKGIMETAQKRTQILLGLDNLS